MKLLACQPKYTPAENHLSVTTSRCIDRTRNTIDLPQVFIHPVGRHLSGFAPLPLKDGGSSFVLCEAGARASAARYRFSAARYRFSAGWLLASPVPLVPRQIYKIYHFPSADTVRKTG